VLPNKNVARFALTIYPSSLGTVLMLVARGDRPFE